MENLSSSTKPALMELARQHNIRGRSTMNKAQLIAALTPLLPRRASTPPSSSSSTSSGTRRNRARHTLIIEFWPKIFGGPRPQDPRDHMPFLLTWFRTAVEFYLRELNEDIGAPIDPNDPHGRRDCRLEGIYGSTRTGNMYVKLSYTGPVIPRERLINDEDTTPLDEMLDPDEDGNDPLVIPRPVRQGRRSSNDSSSESGSASVEHYLIRGNEHVEIVDRLPTNLMQGGMDINMTDMGNALNPIPDKQIALAIKIENAAKEKRGISKGLLAKAHELRTRVLNIVSFTQLENTINLLIGKKKLPEIKESSSSQKKLGKRGRKSSNSEDSAGYDKHNRTRSYIKLDGGSGTMDMSAMDAALAIPPEQLKLADIIDKNIYLAHPEKHRSELETLASNLRMAAISSASLLEKKNRVKELLGNYGSQSENESMTDVSTSTSSQKKKRLARKRPAQGRASASSSS